jgi:hypothetical protein
MNFNQEQHLHPIVVAVDGCEWDIRNLCIGNQEEQFYPQNTGSVFSRRRSEVSDGFKAYPSMRDIPESLNVDDVFDKLNAQRQLEKADRAGNCNSSRNTTPTISPMRYRSDKKSAGATYRSEHQRPGVTWNSHPRHEEDHKQDRKQDHKQDRKQEHDSKSSQREFYNGRQREDEQPSNPAGGGDNNADANRTMVEVMPGEYVPLRGSVETWDAVMSGQVKKTSCACCCLDLVCVQDADLVMCPGCRIISPVDDGGDGGGLGLGMSVQDARYELSQRGLSDLARRFR